MTWLVFGIVLVWLALLERRQRIDDRCRQKTFEAVVDVEMLKAERDAKRRAEWADLERSAELRKLPGVSR